MSLHSRFIGIIAASIALMMFSTNRGEAFSETENESNSFNLSANNQIQGTSSINHLDADAYNQLVDRAVNFMDRGKYKDARLAYKHLCELDPSHNSAVLHYDLALACQRLGSLDEATTEYNLTLHLDSRNQDAAFNLANCYQTQGKIEQEVNALEYGLKIGPTDVAAMVNLAICYHTQGKIEQSIKEYEQVLQIYPHEAAAMINLGSCYQAQGRVKEARELFGRLITEQPNHPQAGEVRKLFDCLKNADIGIGDQNSDDYIASCTSHGRSLWPVDKKTLRIFISAGVGVQGYRNHFRELVIQSLNEWTSASKKLSWTEISNKNEADIVCNWASTPAKLADGGEGGLTVVGTLKSNDDKEEIVNVTVTVYTRDLNGTSSATDPEIKEACLHEVGHALGLSHSPNNNDVMFFSETNELKESLSDRDKRTIAGLYELSTKK